MAKAKKKITKKPAKAKATKKPPRPKQTEAEKKAKQKAKNKDIAKSFAELGADSPHFHSWLKQNVLRRSFRRWPAYYLLFEQKLSKQELRPMKNGVLRKMRVWQCEECKLWYARKELCGDHIEPVGSNPTSTQEVGEMVIRMFCGVKDMQRLCNYKLDDKRFDGPSCHYTKTQAERAENKARKAEQNGK